jgi:hypothetical protein
VHSGWARISKYYDGSVEGASGRVARWVSADYLSPTKPKSAVSTVPETPLERVLINSDDYKRYKSQFVSASKKLIDQGRCALGDFKENGGWAKSASQRARPVYFVYCGGFTRENRIYLDASTGDIFR